MMPRANRLSRVAFKEVLSSSRRRTSLHFSVSVRKSSTSLGECAAVVSKKVAKSAVERHLLKRRILAVSKEYLQQGFSFIVYARADAPSLSFQALSKELKELFTGAFREV